MNDATVNEGSPSVEQIPETACHPDFDLILAHWLGIAARAWQGSLISGPGAVLLTVMEGDPEILYRQGSPCPCHPIEADTYNPETEAIVVVQRGDESSVPVILVGWPSPPHAFAMADASMMQEAVQ